MMFVGALFLLAGCAFMVGALIALIVIPVLGPIWDDLDRHS